MRKLSLTILVLVTAIGVSGCGSVPRPTLHSDLPVRVNKADRVALISVTPTNVMRWYDIAAALQAVQFSWTPDQLLSEAVTTTSSVDSSSAEFIAGSIAAAFAGPSLSKTNTTAVDVTGQKTSTSQRQEALASPATPSALTFNIAAPAVATKSDASTSGIDAQFKLRTAAALAEEVAIVNQRVASLPIDPLYKPYFVSFQVSVLPRQHGMPYDTTLDIQFDVERHPGDKDAPELRDKPTVLVVPLLVTDALEATKDDEVSQVVSQLGAQISGGFHFIGASANLQRTLEALENSESLRPNSLLSVAQLTQEPDSQGPEKIDRTGIRVRIGANRFGRSYEMIPRTHNVSVVLLVRNDFAVENDKMSWSPPVETERAGYFTPRPVINPWNVTIKTRVSYTDPMLRYPVDAEVGRCPDADPRLAAPGCLGPLEIIGAQFPLPPMREVRCPYIQTAIESNVTTQGGAPVATVSLAGGTGLQGRTIRAILTTPKIAIGQPAVEGTIDLQSTNYSLTGDTIQFLFPDHVGAITNKSKSAVTLLGGLKFEVLDTRYGDGLVTCPRAASNSYELLGLPRPKGNFVEYPVAYVLSTPPRPALTAKPKTAEVASTERKTAKSDAEPTSTTTQAATPPTALVPTVVPSIPPAPTPPH